MSKKKLVKKGAIEAVARKLEVAKVRTVLASSVRPNTWNPNRQSDYQFRLLCLSIEQEGYNQFALVRDRPDTDEKGNPQVDWEPGQFEIIDGEHRWTAFIVISYVLAGRGSVENYDEAGLRELRDKREALLATMPKLELPVSWADKTTAQAMIGTLRHNRAAGEEDVELSAAMLRDFQELGILSQAMEDLQLSDLEVNRLIEDVPVSEALAAMEFGEAWEPRKGETVAIEQDMMSDATRGVGMTEGASASVRHMEEKLRAAKTEEDRQKARKEADVYRLVLLFQGEEGHLVRGVLGARPAVKLVEMCKSAVSAQPAGTS